MTYRERREAKAERLREWAAKREAGAAAVFEAGRPFTSDIAFNTQPGHMPFRAKLIAREDRAFESLRKAQGMESRANGIESQLATSIYSDDPDAIEALEARLATLEAERDRIKAYNASCRKGSPDLSLLTEQERDSLASAQRWMPTKNGQMPAYHLTNLSGNITRNRQRLEGLRKAQS
jgi:hypothetical protein